MEKNDVYRRDYLYRMDKGIIPNNDYTQEFNQDYKKYLSNLKAEKRKEKAFTEVLEKQSQYSFLGHGQRTPQEEKKVMDNIAERVKKLSKVAMIFIFTMMIGISAMAQKPIKVEAVDKGVMTSVPFVMQQENLVMGHIGIIWSISVVDAKGVVIYETDFSPYEKTFNYQDSPKPDLKENVYLLLNYQCVYPDMTIGNIMQRKGITNVDVLKNMNGVHEFALNNPYPFY